MIKMAICDDNSLQLDMLNDILTEYIENNHGDIRVDKYTSGRDLLDSVKNGFYEIYILDMIMPDMNGLEVASTLRMMKCSAKIIFLTATLEYAVASYDVQAFYYLVKPVDKNRLFRVLDNATSELTSRAEIFTVKNRQGELRLYYKDLLYVDMSDRMLQFHMRDGRTAVGSTIRISFREAVAVFLERPNFVLCGAGMMINLDFIDAMSSESVMMRDGTQIFPPKTSYAELHKTWRKYCKQ